MITAIDVRTPAGLDLTLDPTERPDRSHAERCDYHGGEVKGRPAPLATRP
jgi:hypothetical protein